MATTENKWVFVQLGGDRKVLELSGWSAPFGRPRQGAVVADEIEVRHATTYYPGNSEGPTRHLFGVKYAPFELSGRFMDRASGVGYAQKKADEVKQFVLDQQEVAIRWSDTILATGFIDKFVPKREGPGDVAWTMTVQIDRDDKADRPVVTPLVQDPGYFVQRIRPMMPAITTDILDPQDHRLRGDLFEIIDLLVGNVTTAFSYVADVAEQIDTFSRSALGTINRFRASLHQFKTVGLQLRATIDRLTADTALSTRRATEEQEWSDTRARFAANLAIVLAEIADADRQARLAQQGRIRAIVTGRLGDTWETLSIRVYGSGDRAGDLRDANGVASGEHPEVGVDYLAPV